MSALANYVIPYSLHALFIKLMKRNVPVQLLALLENMLFDCYSCVKWENIHSDFFTVMFGVRQGSVLAPFLFAIFLDELSDTCNLSSSSSSSLSFVVRRYTYKTL